MPDIPRDPRQLARDILAGKVRIEDLQRERQLRGGQGGGAGVPARIPLPRQAPPLPRPVQRAPMPPQRSMPQRQPSAPMPSARIPSARMPMPARQSMPLTVPPRTAPLRPTDQPAAAQPVQTPQATESVARSKRGLGLGELVKSRQALRQGIMLAEVLGKPVSMRNER